MALVSLEKHYRDHLSNKFNSLEYLVGAPIKILCGIQLYAKPESARLIGNYAHTVLIEMEFIKDWWNPGNETPRYVRRTIPKALLATGEVKLETLDGMPLWGSAISHRVLDEEVYIG